MKNILVMVVLAITMSCFAGCSSSQKAVDEGKLKPVDDPMKALTLTANELIQDGCVAAVGEGISSRRDLAHQKAKAEADGALAEVFNTKVQRMRKNFLEEVGNGKEAEVNELFTVVTKELTSQVLYGAIEKDYKMFMDDEGKYVCGSLKVISPKTVNMSILDEMKTKKPQLYQRYRGTKAFEEMEKDMKDYEAAESE